MPVSERKLIDRIRRQVGRGRNRWVVAGIGDDCSILRLPPGHEALVTTDFSLEGIHFRRDWHPPEVVGHRCLTRGLSDVAAMGGQPLAAFLSLALPARLPQSWIDRFMKGFLRLSKEFGVVLAGGDTAESPDGILADIMIVGSTPRGRALRRSEARPGDRIWVTGDLGGSAAAIAELRKRRGNVRAADYPRHYFPVPRLEVGRVLRERSLPSAMIDLSDGLSTDLAHICQESGTGAAIREESVPRASVGRPARGVDLRLALHGGEDYELLFTAHRDAKVPKYIAGVRVTEIGRITRQKGLSLQHRSGVSTALLPHGWEHFQR
ncbi:MAG TPA: thiamine-phosphate kinase [Terriglobales bacterium]|jgi:thiamine-monophosphate kinase